MKKIALTLIAFSMVSSIVFEAASADEKFEETTVQMIAKKFADNLDCRANSKDMWRVWCGAAMIAQNAKPIAPPQASTTYLGISVVIKETEPLKTSFLDQTSLSALTLGPNTAKLHSIKPSNAGENKDIFMAVATTALILKGMGEPSSINKISSGLLSYLKGLSREQGYPFTLEGNSASYMGQLASRLYRVGGLISGDVFVVFEKTSDGAFVSVFPAIGLK